LNFVGQRGWFYLISLLVIVPGVVFLAIAPGLRPGIDFTGGSTLTLAFETNVDQTDLRERLAALGHPEATVQKLGDDTYFIRTKELDDAEKAALTGGLEARLSPDGLTELSFDLVSPVVASETVINAIYAVVAAAVGIFIYVWWAFRNVPSPFRYGAAAIAALIHDTVIVIGVFAILGALLEIEVGTMFLIALLTVIGYSVNDTIVVFDRIRENVTVHPNRELSEVVNLSISETIGRSLNTSLTLLITLLALFLFGGSTIREFLLVLLIGVVAGTYSSIAVASQVLISWEYGDIPWLFGRGRRARTASA
jgi:preprotein translocase subunit SecF